MNVPAELSAVISAWKAQLYPAWGRMLMALSVGAAMAALFVARQGTRSTRLAAVSLLVGTLALLLGAAIARRRLARRPNIEVVKALRRVDRAMAGQLERALELSDRVSEAVDSDSKRDASSISAELVQLHLQRLAAKLPVPEVEQLARTRAAHVSFIATLGGIACCVTAWFCAVQLFEGFDVLLAQGNRAPLAMRHLDVDSVLVQPPAYLRTSPEQLDFDSNTAQPEGSQVIVRGIPRHQGRVLGLSDGSREVPFVNDGQGGLVAHYLIEQSVSLKVVERLGDVTIPERARLSIEAIVDEPPRIALESAPKHIPLEDTDTIDLNYTASDDHGLRQLELVLRSGSREERRVLSRLDGETRQFAGAHVIFAQDPFITSSYGAVDLFVAARDDNNRPGAKWGQSAAITLDKPSLGRPQVRRYEAFRSVRDKLVDWLASLVHRPETERVNAAAAKAVHPVSEPRKNEASDALANANQVAARVTATLSALVDLEDKLKTDRSVRRALLSFVRAQHQKLSRVSGSRQQRIDTLSEIVLAIDAAMESVSRKDSEHVAMQLADVAVEIEAGAKAAQLAEQRQPGIERITAASSTLIAGAAELKRLGTLGADLGEISKAGATRIERAFKVNDFENVQRAASFLAERLRRPSSSFVGGGRPGVESMRRSARRGGAKPSEADLHLERVMTELQQLAREHATSIEGVEQIVQDSERVTPAAEANESIKQHAEALRRAVSDLPTLGGEPGSQRASLGLAKELVRGAAESLERLQLLGAYEGLNKAESALLEADKLTESSDDRANTSSSKRREQLALERAWVKEQLDRTREHALSAMRESLRQAGGRERELSDRANRLAQREGKGDAVLPEDIRSDLEQASQWMRQAGDGLESGRARLALEHQRRAQSLLERNEPESERDASDRGNQPDKTDRDSSKAGKGSGHGNVVPTSDVESREAFRRRVQKGLSQKVPPDLSPAVRRYAEGLLK